MEFLGNYLLRIIAASLFCGIIRSFSNESVYHKWIHLLLGLILMIIIIKPVRNINLTSALPELHIFYEESERIAEQGSIDADEALEAVILQRLCTYTEEKAASLGASLCFSFRLNDGIPCAVLVTGNAAPYVKAQLSHWMTTELGIPKEAQDWS